MFRDRREEGRREGEGGGRGGGGGKREEGGRKELASFFGDFLEVWKNNLGEFPASYDNSLSQHLWSLV